MDRNWFRSVLVFTEGWKGIGWSAIVYLAAITGIDPQLYEAAIVDGVTNFNAFGILPYRGYPQRLFCC